MRIVFQGVHGAYSEAAARAMFGARQRTVPVETFGQAFAAVERGTADRAVIPIENSLAGSIHENYDLLLSHPLQIVGETFLRIEHALLGLPGSTVRQLTEVRSHPQALSQCSDFFRSHPGIRSVPFFDTAGAAQWLAESGERSMGAIAGSLAARMYGLKTLRKNLENRPTNYTRFLALSRTPTRAPRSARLKCSVAFRPKKNQVGILFRILGVFALRDIDLVKIESRPDPSSPFQYLFYVDLAGDPRDPAVASALGHLQEMAADYRFLGAYPFGSYPFGSSPSGSTQRSRGR
jgi:prephenate dehydratase